ncbi:MAG: penicillin-binding protein 1C [Bacteroidota bacterium]|nr:penicillin-binding protein 1C [Bacteroidota bacterium]MDP3145747.1 penicillin-binding protein 1C [Bacteroidota bacterium]
MSLTYWLWLPNKLFTTSNSTVLLDANNELLAAQIAADGQWRFPQGDSIPVKFAKCITVFEDEYFYSHPGINPISILKSIKRNFGSGKIKSGGSTITMQIARMMRNHQNRNYYQKIVEILLAVRIELSYKKSSILNLYCSNAPFGSNVVGLSAASWRYYGRSPEKLSWAESALLAVLPNSPSLIYPGKNHDALIKKRNRLLKKLSDKNIIDKSTYQLSVQEPLPNKPYPIPQLASHLLMNCIAEQGGSKIYHSTIIKSLQVQANDLLNKQVQNLSANQIHNACLIVAETQTGKVLAYVGNSSSSKNEHENYVDIIKSPRSTGSILKPFLYAFMLNENKILPASFLEDVPTQIGSYGPKNFNLTYDGLVPANKAIARSLNVPAIKMLQDYSAVKFHYRLKQLGFKTFNKPTSHYGLSLILGGGEATLWDIASAYSSMGRALKNYSNTRNKYSSNNYRSLHYLNVKNRDNNAATQNTDLLNASSLWYTFSAMTELLRPQDYIGWMQFLSKNKIAWKTGTSFGFRDAWAVGLNSKYTVAVWVGNADGEGRPELTGTAAAAPLLFSVFNILPNKIWFNKPTSDVEKITVCKQSGFKASEICNDVEIKYFQKGCNKTKQCPYHKLIHLDETETYRVNSNCYSIDKMKHVPWFVVSPTQEYFFKQHSLFYKPLPNYLPECYNDKSLHQLDIIYPREGFKIYVPIDQSGARSKCIFKATHKINGVTLFWHLDGNYIGSTQKFHQLSILPDKGNHLLEITDDFGESVKCKFEVIDK